MRIPAATEAYNATLRRTENSKRTDKPRFKPKGMAQDKSELSSDAKRLSETKGHLETVISQLRTEGDIRQEKVADARQKIKDGFYNSEEVVDRLAGKLLREFGFQGG